MRLQIPVASIAVAMALGLGYGSAANAASWSDDFNSFPSSANWTFETGGGGWGNNELEYYQQANTTVSGGIMTIQARHESVGGMAYTSSRMNTAGHHDWTSGTIEGRMRGPNGQVVFDNRAYGIVHFGDALSVFNGAIDVAHFPALQRINDRGSKQSYDLGGLVARHDGADSHWGSQFSHLEYLHGADEDLGVKADPKADDWILR